MSKGAPSEAAWYKKKPLRREVRKELLLVTENANRRLSSRDAAQETSYAVMQDTLSALRARGILKGDKAPDNPDLAVSADVLRSISAVIADVKHRSKYVLEEPAIRDYLATQALHGMNLPRNSSSFFARFLQHRSQDLTIPSADDSGVHVLDELFAMHQEVARHAPQDASFVYTLHVLLEDIQSLRRLVVSHTGSDYREDRSFFVQLREALIYLSSLLEMRSDSTEFQQRDALRMHGLIGGMLHSRSIRDPKVNTLELAGGRCADPVTFDYLLRHTPEQGPFDGKRLYTLFSVDRSPQLIANTLERVDVYEAYARIWKASSLLLGACEGADGEHNELSVWNVPAVATRLRDFQHLLWRNFVDSSSDERPLPAVSPLLQQRIDALRSYFPQNDEPQSGAIEQLRRIGQPDALVEIEETLQTLPDSNPAKEQVLLLHVLVPHKIATNDLAQRLFLHHYQLLLDRGTELASQESLDRLWHILRSEDPYLHYPLQLASTPPEYQGKTLADLLRALVVLVFPERWHTIVPRQVESAISVSQATLSNSMQCAMKPIYRRSDIQRVAERFVRDWGAEDFEQSVSFLRSEVAEHFGGANAFEEYEVIPHASGSAVFPHVIDSGLSWGAEDRFLALTREYLPMIHSVNGHGSSSREPLCIADTNPDGKPLSLDELTATLLTALENDSSVRCVVISLVSRLGSSPLGSKKHPTKHLRSLLACIRESYPHLCVVLDVCQAIGRMEMPSMSDLDSNTIVLATGKKMLGSSQCGFAIVHRSIADRIRACSASCERNEDTSSSMPCATLNDADIVEMALLLHEARSTSTQMHRLSSDWMVERPPRIDSAIDHDDIPDPLATHVQHISLHLQKITAYVVQKAKEYVQLHEIFSRDCSWYLDLEKRDCSRLLRCDIVAPHNGQKAPGYGIVTMHFPTMPAEHLEAELKKKGIHTSGLCLDQSCIRIAFHPAITPENIDNFFLETVRTHSQYITEHGLDDSQISPSEIERRRVTSFE